MHGLCLVCGRETEWKEQLGWVFHTYRKHWRCVECHSSTEQHLWPPGAKEFLLANIKAHRKDQRVRIKLKLKGTTWKT